MIRTVAEHGRPPANAALKFIGCSSDDTGFEIGQIVYVKPIQSHARDDEVLIHQNPNASVYDGGWYITKWEEVDSPINTISDETKKELVRLAREAAKKRGYCEETDNILRDIGLLPTPVRVYTFEADEDATVQVRVDGSGIIPTFTIKE